MPSPAPNGLAVGGAVVASAGLVGLLGLPIAALVLRVPPGQLLRRLGDPEVLEASHARIFEYARR